MPWRPVSPQASVKLTKTFFFFHKKNIKPQILKILLRPWILPQSWHGSLSQGPSELACHPHQEAHLWALCLCQIIAHSRHLDVDNSFGLKTKNRLTVASVTQAWRPVADHLATTSHSGKLWDVGQEVKMLCSPT